jgi:hypothetical protein
VTGIMSPRNREASSSTLNLDFSASMGIRVVRL